MPTVNPDILIWARESAGLTPADAVKKLGIGDARGMDAISRLSAYESGHDDPTRPMLVKMARQYRRPLLTFYLSEPPQKGDRGVDFRTLPSEERDAHSEALVDALIRDVQARQSMVRAVIEDEEEAEPLAFIGSAKVSDGKDTVLELLKQLLDIELQDYRSQPDDRAAFNFLRKRAGSAGIFVLLKGDLGSYHSALDVKVFRGFSLADAIAPFIVINDRDTQAAWSFTLLHEIVHLLLGQTGVSGLYTDNGNEAFCDAVAGEFLLPTSEVIHIRLHSGLTMAGAEAIISEFARSRKISLTMVAYNAYRVGQINKEYYNQLSDYFYEKLKEARRNRREESGAGGPSYYVVRRHHIGDELLHLVRRMMGTGALTSSKAARILGVHPARLQALFEG